MPLHPVGFFTGDVAPQVDASVSDVIHVANENPCRAGVTYNATGLEFSNSAGQNNYNVSRGFWLTAGNAEDVWLERTWTGDTLDIDPGAGRHNLGSPVLFEIQDTSPGGGPESGTLTVDFYDADSGGNLLDSVTYDLSASRESGA